MSSPLYYSKETLMLVSSLNVPVSLILVSSAIFCLTRTIRGRSWVVRLNYVIHGFMAFGMLGMVWHDFKVPFLPQVLLFGLAAFWFVLQAVSRPEYNLGCTTRSGRLKCLYHAAMLAAMVFMLTLPHSVATSEPSIVVLEHSGHTTHAGQVETVATAMPSALDVSSLLIQPIAQVLTLLFAIAVLAWLSLGDGSPLRTFSRRTLTTLPPAGNHHLVLERTNEAGAALVMSLMFAAISLQS